MKIFQLIQKPQLRGAEIFACQLSTELNDRGHECVVIALFPGESKLPFAGRTISLGLSKRHRFLDWSGWKKLAALVEKEKPDIVQANAGDTLKYAIISKLLFRWQTKVVFRNASTVSLYIKNPWVKKWNAMLYSHTDHIFSVSQYTRDDFTSMFPETCNRVTVIPIGIKGGNATSDSMHTSGTPVLLHVGGFTFEKNHAGLLRIMHEVVKNNSAVTLWLVGDGPLRAEMENLAKSMDLMKNVKFWGYQPNPGEFFRQATVFLLPSIIEGLPAVILESFFYKIPVVAYQVGGVAELVRNGETGFLIQKGNEQEFVDAIMKVLQGDSEISRYVENACRMVVDGYTIRKVAVHFEALYIKLLSGSSV